MAGPAGVGHTENWSSRFAFVMAAVGSAVGLGNLVRFPAEAGSNGGGAFVIFYIFCVVMIGLPVLLAETVIGRYGKSSAVDSVSKLARASGRSPLWAAAAFVGMLGAYFILTYYSVIGGWVVYFAGVFVDDMASAVSGGTLTQGAFAGQNSEDVASMLGTLHGNAEMMVAMHALFMAITIFVVARGVTGGIEKVAVWLMPTFFLLFLAITVYSMLTGAFTETLSFLFSFEPSRLLDPNVMLSALGQALFSLSLGSALMITYGAYASADTDLAKTSGMIGSADTSVAIIAGLAIFPIVFAAMTPDLLAEVLSGEKPVPQGLGLMFSTLPVSFQTMPGGSLIGLLFFVMVFFAALTSSVALLEASVSWASRQFNISRSMTAVVLGLMAFAIGAVASFSFNTLADFKPLPFGIFDGLELFSILDTVTGKIMLPVSALLVAIFVGWIADKRIINAQNGLSGGTLALWRFLIAWLCPLVIAAILFFGLFPNLIKG
ncbi:sodium-dependent transporter [Alterisphingorhabdus coralli]|uniref:Sodium-dependent transporter n=1 Tax=Alterisphingorhabdus coralli TaxID=3071408 RepID=A0AA97F5K1_9SPHN|nr:sodium-dependent transporter [Parasphingorhabdus sp. SCSIO 66989]WOE74401.1 sodium-dependent transporter [Parasphingorhabdus sp. SCSIO 66989]